MHRKTLTYFARVRGGTRAPPPQPPQPEMPAVAPPAAAAPSVAPSSSGLSLEQIRQQMRLQQQRRSAAGGMGVPQQQQQQQKAAPSASADPLMAHIVSTAAASPPISLPNAASSVAGRSRGGGFSSPYFAREAAKEDSQRALGARYRQKKAVDSFEEIFPAMGAGLMGRSAQDGDGGGQNTDKRRYLELMASLSPTAPSPHYLRTRRDGGLEGSKKGEAPTTTIPQQRTALVGSLAAKMKERWAAHVRAGFEAYHDARKGNGGEGAVAVAPTPIEREAVLATALEALVGEMTDEELLVAAKTGLLDVEALSGDIGAEAHPSDTAANADTDADGGDESLNRTVPPTIAAAVLPADLTHSLAHAATLSEWLTDASAIALGGQADDDIAPLLVRARDPSAYGSFTEEELQRLEAFEAGRRRGMGLDESDIAGSVDASRRQKKLLPDSLAGSAEEKQQHTGKAHMPHSTASVATNPLIGTNPLLHRLAALSPPIAESLHVMNRTRLSALSDKEFQQALAYTNAQFQREYSRQCDRAEMRPLSDEEVRTLQLNAGRRPRIGQTRAQMDAAAAKAATGHGVDGIGASDASRASRRQLRQQYGSAPRTAHAFDMAKAMRVLNPQASIRPSAATDVPLFFDPTRSVPPASAGMGMPLPSMRKRGRRMVREKRDPKHLFEE